MRKKPYVLWAFLIPALLLPLLSGCGKASDNSAGATEYIVGQSIEPGYTRYEPGHWDKTDILYFGPNEETRREDELTITAGRDDKQNIVYTFTAADGSRAEYTVELYWLRDFYYASDYIYPKVNIWRAAEPDDAPGDVIASLAVGDIEPGAGDYGVKVDVRSYFGSVRDGAPYERFSIGENMTQDTGYDGTKYYLDTSGHLPEGIEDGEKIYIVLGVMDGGEGTTRMYTAWEYTWAAEPETIEVPDQYGPIEYFEYTPPEISGHISPLLILVPAAVIGGAVVLIVRAVKKRRKKKTGQETEKTGTDR